MTADPGASLGFWEGRRYADAVVDALSGAGYAPWERWEEAAGIAFFWTEGTPAWPCGLVLFWRRNGGWVCAPLDSEGNPDRSAFVSLPIHPVADPASLAVMVPLLLRHGIEGTCPPVG